mmetsp:Transcript_4122/g.15209  ORF Transcript_4122/g.15209 Transcript_4122/m.15209 type:complete len:114 (+) Transcript_4122:213-554(+)
MSTLLRSSHLGDSSSTKKGLLAVLPPISSPTKIIRSPLNFIKQSRAIDDQQGGQTKRRMEFESERCSRTSFKSYAPDNISEFKRIVPTYPVFDFIMLIIAIPALILIYRDYPC